MFHFAVIYTVTYKRCLTKHVSFSFKTSSSIFLSKPSFFISVNAFDPECSSDNLQTSDLLCPFYINNKEITHLHISACDSDPFYKNEDYTGFVLLPHKIHGMKYDLGIKQIRAGQIIVKKTSTIFSKPGKTPHQSAFQVSLA